ncbi:CotH kinase family protein [Ferviditalea candida]|uniref:CotH kinase family protein n=1 Tax=Ferviditalea candida TaxID=3108399 RepID=A0ABU5ZC32_9BACL|nr:CotH kinase family protein [Paenibacillaceae bacterium T2]
MGLPFRHIVIQHDEQMALEENIWSPKYVNAYLLKGNVREPIQLRYRGGHTREYPKRSYEIVRGNETIHLNAEYDDPSLIRNALSFQFFEWIGVPCPKAHHCQLILNEQSQGVYLEIEAVDSNFFRQRKIPVQSIIYAVNGKANFSLINPDTNERKASLFKGYDLVKGKDSDRQRFKLFILKLNTLKNLQLYKYLSANLDIENYLHWLAGVVFTGNYDGFDQNYAIYLHKIKRYYRIIPWDYEGTWGRNCYGKRVDSDLVRVAGYNRLTKNLLAFTRVRRRYKEILKEILAKTFTVKKISPGIYQMYREIAPYIYRDNARKWPFHVFEEEPALIQNYIHERRKIIAKALSEL